uniref:Uncharacterized protein n=1 Tax=Electrophorus electricus TaxID=8005 RepID=A0AAY5EA43_ELEEL
TDLYLTLFWSFQTARWSALLVGIIWQPIAAEEKRVEEAEKKLREEQERIYKQLSEGLKISFALGCCRFILNYEIPSSFVSTANSDTILK